MEKRKKEFERQSRVDKKKKRKERRRKKLKALKLKLIRSKQLSAQLILMSKELSKTLIEIGRMYMRLTEI